MNDFRLLLIEDSPTQLLTIARTLENERYKVLEAQDGAEGITRAYMEQPDMIISDVRMEGINGYQLCRLLKSDPELKNIPVILLTKLDGTLDRFWGLKSGCDRYVPKEPGFATLLKAVKDLLGQMRPRIRVLADKSSVPDKDEINARLNQLLERLLFESTVIDEVRHIGEGVLNLKEISEKLFELLSSIVNYSVCVLVVNEEDHAKIIYNPRLGIQIDSAKAYAAKLAKQLGLPPINEEVLHVAQHFEGAVTQPIDSAGCRLAFLLLVPKTHQKYTNADLKVINLICEQLSVVLRLYRTYNKLMVDKDVPVVAM